MKIQMQTKYERSKFLAIPHGKLWVVRDYTGFTTEAYSCIKRDEVQYRKDQHFHVNLWILMCHYTLKCVPGKVAVNQSLGERGEENRKEKLLRHLV